MHSKVSDAFVMIHHHVFRERERGYARLVVSVRRKSTDEDVDLIDIIRVREETIKEERIGLGQQ